MTECSKPATAKALLPYPSRLIVETTTRCNLACAMCPKQAGRSVSPGSAGARGNPEGSASIDGLGGLSGPDGDLDEASFAALEPAFPRLESLVLNGIGEPLLHPGLEDFIRRAGASMPESGLIGFQTNGHLLDEGRADSLVEAGLNRVCVSIDALDTGLFGQIRQGGDSAAAWAAVDALGRARANASSGARGGSARGGASAKTLGHAAEHARGGKSPSRLSIGIEFVVMRSNIEELPLVVERAARSGVDYVIVSQLFPYGPDSMGLAAWDANLDTALELERKYASIAFARGLDLGGYSGVYMKYDKSPEDIVLVGLVAELQAEAIARGVTVNVERLLSRKKGLSRASASSFAKARALAEAAGIELVLPELVPRSSRHCEFVEGGSVFVSRDGKAHPCYFLWHRYACHAGGWEKRVAPRSFGSLAERGILDIWNDEAFAAFRANVLRYEYPFCLNCNLALCDYVQLEDFEQDCHINAEPCAVCLWCMGLFKCMF